MRIALLETHDTSETFQSLKQYSARLKQNSTYSVRVKAEVYEVYCGVVSPSPRCFLEICLLAGKLY